jgi:phospholipid/cholesterol/gamma-HCH transport system permease protein
MEQDTRIEIQQPADGEVELRLEGAWSISAALPEPAEVLRDALDRGATLVRFHGGGIADWDSILLTFLRRFETLARERGLDVDRSGLPDGILRLLALAEAVPRKEETRAETQPPGFLERWGLAGMAFAESAGVMLAFLGESMIAMGRFVTGRARYRGSDVLLIIQDCGPRALPIVTLISVLVGLILAFIGAVQLELFGAEIYVANLVAIGMAREMGALMTAIIMSGRTGAAFAAELGTMQVNEEIDAFVTFGISPMEFLVLPRMLALCVMMPLLCLYADFMGIIGGAVVGIGLLDITPIQYFNQSQQFLGVSDFGVGVFKATVFGILIAVSGCMRGMECGRSSAAVGQAATSAVVLAIVLIVVTDGLFAVLFHILGI